MLTRFFITLVLILASASLILAHSHDHDDHDEFITCGSTVKIIHKASGYHLHSSQAAWGTGSTELAVTSVPAASSKPNTLWQFSSEFFPESPDKQCAFGETIKCGDTIRLKHSSTQTHLRSQNYKAPLSGNQEVSSENRGDKSFENFQLLCVGNNNAGQDADKLQKSMTFKLKHLKTNKFLSTRTQDQFNQNNCRGCPIQGHLEMHCKASDDSNALFTIGDGYFVPENKERVVYDYTDLSPEVKIVSGPKPKSDKKNGKHDEL